MLLGAFLPGEDFKIYHSLAGEADSGRVTLLTAPHCFLEAGTGLLRAVRRSRLTEGLANEAWSTLGLIRLAVVPFPERDALFTLALREQLSLYDAAYLGAAIDHQAQLATADKALASAARRHGLLWAETANDALTGS